MPASHLLQNSVLFDDRGHLVVQYFVTTVSSCFFFKTRTLFISGVGQDLIRNGQSFSK